MKADTMAENKTRPTAANVQEFLAGIVDPVRRNECMRLSEMMQEITGAEPRMWGDSIVGFGHYRYAYASGRKGEWFLTGFSPRKQNLTIYVKGYLENYKEILKDLGRHKRGKGCLYIRTLDDVELETLRSLIIRSVETEKNI